MVGKGLLDGFLSEEDVFSLAEEAFSEINVEGKRVLIIIPDHTRTAPMDIFFRAFYNTIVDRVKKLDFIIALGTHPPISQESIFKIVGITSEEYETKYNKVDFYNHEWNNPHHS